MQATGCTRDHQANAMRVKNNLPSGLPVMPRIKGVGRIVVVTHSFPTPAQPYRGKSNLEMLRALNRMVDVQVVCPFSRYPRWMQPKWHRSPDPDFSPGGVQAYYLEYPAFPVITRAFNGLTCANYAEPLVRALQPDVILNYWIYPVGFAAVTLARRLRVPAVVGSIGSDLHNIPDAISRYLSGWTVRNADYVITKSESLRQHAIGLGADAGRTRAIHNGCDAAIFTVRSRTEARRELGINPSAHLILYVGRFDIKKGVRELAQAARELAKSDRNIKLIFAGNGPDEGVLRRMVAQPGGEQIEIIGRLEPASIAQWLAACDVFSLPSYDEGCPNAILEALCCGRPVVATNVGGIPEVMNESCGYMVAARDVAALAAALRQALDRRWDEQLLARQFRRDFETMAREVLEVCETALKRPLPKWQAAPEPVLAGAHA
ncbi:MAG: glycosyltransferase [Acidobacteria bacterium]|nr:glycosyltransferase [Acidobacteriota bacterium]